MRKILIFIEGYLPGEKYGGPVTSIYNFTEALGEQFGLYIVAKNHDLDSVEVYTGISDGWNRVGKANVFYFSDSSYNKKNFIHLVKEINPDLIYSTSIFTLSSAIPSLVISKKWHIPILFAVRGELNPRALKQRAWKKYPYLFCLICSGLLKHVYFQGTSPGESQNIANVLGTDQEHIITLPNLPVAVKEKTINKIPGQMKVIYISRIVKNKNLKYAIEIISKLKSQVEMDIYGPIEENEYWQSCESIIAQAPDNVQITYKGKLSPERAKDIYLQYDCLLLPTLFENYGQVIAEAIAHDCIPVISKGTTPWDDLDEQVTQLTYTIGDDIGFITALEKIAAADTKAMTDMITLLRRYAKNKIDVDMIRDEYIDVINQLIKTRGN